MKICKQKTMLLLARKGMSLGDLVELTGLCKSNLSRALNGKSIRPLTVHKISCALAVDPEEIIEKEV